jgi:hypothetical protein
MTSETFLEEWHRIVGEKDLVALEQVLAKDVTIGAPPYWAKLPGRPLVHHLLGLIIETIEDFTYHREWIRGQELALEFQGHVGDLDVQGVDLITIDDDGLVTNIDVPMRPANAVARLQEIIGPQMAAYLAKEGSSRD